MQLDEPLGERQAEAGPLVPPGERGIELGEGLKELWNVFGSDPDPRILHGDFHEIAVSFMVHGEWFMDGTGIAMNCSL